MGQTMNKDLEAIRHFAGTVSDFKDFFDQKAAETAKKDEENTNAYGTPEYQGFNDVHPTRGANASPHWKESVNLEEKKNENPFKKGDKVIVDKIVGMTHSKQSDARRFNGKKGIVISTQGNYVSVNLKGFRSPDIEFATHELKLDESVNEGKPSTEDTYKKIKDLSVTALKGYARRVGLPSDVIRDIKDIDSGIDEIMGYLYDDSWESDLLKQGVLESVNEAKEVEVTQEMWDKEWKIRKTFGKEYEEHFAKRIEAAMSKAKNEEMAENWAFINWKQLPGKADGMTIKESSSTSTKGDRLPLFEDFQG